MQQPERVASLLAPLNDQICRLTYRQAEAATKRLAARLVARFGRSELSCFRYTAIPSGGLIVLGMLAYVLDLDGKALLRQEPEHPLVVVDDCSLSGNRFAHFLQGVDGGQVIFAHLYSHPELRAAIQRQEPRVVACLAAHDLQDLGGERYPSEEEYRASRERWRKRVPGPRYWLGLTELVVFPWNEPDHAVWNPIAEQVEDDWRMTAPDRCLKNWARLGMPPRLDAHPTLRARDDVAFRLEDDEVLLYDLRNEQLYGLQDVGADMWRAIAAYGDLDAAAEHLLSHYEIDEARLREDLMELTDQLLTRGLLERVDEREDAVS
jgi:hypothetical protein